MSTKPTHANERGHAIMTKFATNYYFILKVPKPGVDLKTFF